MSICLHSFIPPVPERQKCKSPGFLFLFAPITQGVTLSTWPRKRRLLASPLWVFMSGLEGTAEGQWLAGNRRRGHPGPDLCSQEFWSSDSGPAHLALGRSLSSAPRQLQVLGHLVLSSSPCLTSPIPNHSRHAADSALCEAPIPGLPPQPLSCSPAPDSWTHLPFNGPASELSLTPRGLLRSLPLTNSTGRMEVSPQTCLGGSQAGKPGPRL